MKIVNANSNPSYNSVTSSSIPGKWCTGETPVLSNALSNIINNLGGNKIILSEKDRTLIDRLLSLDKEGRSVKLTPPLTPAEAKRLRVKQLQEAKEAKMRAEAAKHKKIADERKLINSDSSFAKPDSKSVAAQAKTQSVVEDKEIPSITQKTSLADIMAHNRSIKNKKKNKRENKQENEQPNVAADIAANDNVEAVVEAAVAESVEETSKKE